MLIEEPEVATTILVSSVKLLQERRELVKKFAQAHAELTEWITKNPAEAQKIFKAEFLKETKNDMAADLIVQSWKRIVFTHKVPRVAVEGFLQSSVKTGFIKTAPDLKRLFHTP